MFPPQDKHRYESVLQFKKPMRVVLQHNLDPEAGLVNGTQGIIVDFEEYGEIKLPVPVRKVRNVEAMGQFSLGHMPHTSTMRSGNTPKKTVASLGR